MKKTEINQAKLWKLTKYYGFLGLDNFYLKKPISGTIKMFLFSFGVLGILTLGIYLGITLTNSLQTAEEMGRAASIVGPIATDVENGVNTNTPAKQVEYFLFAYNVGKTWLVEQYLPILIILPLAILAFVIILGWWIVTLVLTKKGLNARLHGWTMLKQFFTTHKVVESNYQAQLN